MPSYDELNFCCSKDETKNNCNNILDLPYTDDEKSKHLEMESAAAAAAAAVQAKLEFEGISDETNMVLNTLCSKNQHLAEFFDKTSESASDSSIASASSLSNRSSNLYKAVPVSPIEIISVKQSPTLFQPNDTVITYIIEHDSFRLMWFIFKSGCFFCCCWNFIFN